MPDKDKLAPVPEQMSFEKGLVNNDTDLGNMTHHSFMDIGEQNDAHKERVASGVRNTLLSKMADENQKSADEADDAANEMDRFKRSTLNKAVENANADMRSAIRAEADALVLEAGVDTGRLQSADSFLTFFSSIATAGGNSADQSFIADKRKTLQKYVKGQSGFYKTITRRSGRSRSARSNADAKKQKALQSVQDVRLASEEWKQQLRRDYHDNIYRPRSQAYDRLFMAYYTMSRKDPNKPNDGNPMTIPDQNAVKNIAEYTGRFSDAGISAFENRVTNNGTGLGDPYGTYDFSYDHDTSRDTSDGRFRGLNKIHSKVNAQAFGPGIKNYVEEQSSATAPPRTRYKITSTFEAYLSRKQVTRAGGVVVDDAGTDVAMDLDIINLVEDEKGVNGSRLYSQKSAKIYKRKTKQGDEVEGFYVAGQFVPADQAKVTGEGGYARFGNTSDDKMEQREKVRTAIRRSDFFKHINAASIEYYMKYNGYNPQGAVEQVNGNSVSLGAMSKRDSFFSKEGLKQALINGEMASLVGDVAGVFTGLGGLPSNNTPEDWSTDWGKYSLAAYSKAVGDFVEFQSDAMNFADDPIFGSAMASTNLSLLVALPAAGVIPGFTVASMCQRGARTLVYLVKMGYAIYKKTKGQNTDESVKVMLLKMVEPLSACAKDIADFVNMIAHVDPDVVSGQIVGLVADVISLIANTVKAIRAGVMYHKIDSSDKELESALKAWKDKNVNVSAEKRAQGEVVSKNAQTRFFLSLAKGKEKKEGIRSGIDAVTSGLNVMSDGFGLGGSAVASAAFKISSKATNFISFFYSKMSDRSTRRDIVGQALGDRKLDSVSGFNEVLKDETGINNRYYLNDLARVFMAIDLHAMATNNGTTEAEKKVGVRTLANIIPRPGQVDDNTYLKSIKLDDLLKAVAAPNDWRSVLLASIS